MKIGILTQPLASNYGGILQNYALQVVLKRLGHNPYTIHYGKGRIADWVNVWFRYFIKVIIRHPGRKHIPLNYKAFINICNCPCMADFIKENIQTTMHIGANVNYDAISSYNFDAYVVGSDQVWRPMYNKGKCLGNMYLDFVKDVSGIKRVAYAASFGVDDWEYSSLQTKKSRELIKLFDAVSVREKSAVDLCENFLNKEALHLLDPTMLLSAEDYRMLFKDKKNTRSQGDVLVYLLDITPEARTLIDTFCKTNNLTAFYICASEPNKPVFSIDSWLEGIDTAKYVITDSFHGSVFSIIFNKPFVSIGNKGRGMSRFNSLLSMFNLEDRLITADSEITQISTPDWEKVNKILTMWREKSIEFLINNLK